MHLYGVPQPYRDAFAAAPSAHQEYGRPLSRASSRSGYGGPRNFTSGANSPVVFSRNNRQQRQEIFEESSSDESPNKRRSPKKSTRHVLKSLDLHASDMGSSSESDDSMSPSVPLPRMTRDPRVSSTKDMHFTTSSTDEDRHRRRAWEDRQTGDPQHGSAHTHGGSHTRSGSLRNPTQSKRSTVGIAPPSDAGSADEGFDRHDSVLQSALSVVRGLQHDAKFQSGSIDMDDVDNRIKPRGHTPAQRSNTWTPPQSNRQVTQAVGAAPKLACFSCQIFAVLLQ